MVWLWLTSLALLIGAEVNAAATAVAGQPSDRAFAVVRAERASAA